MCFLNRRLSPWPESVCVSCSIGTNGALMFNQGLKYFGSYRSTLRSHKTKTCLYDLSLARFFEPFVSRSREFPFVSPGNIRSRSFSYVLDRETSKQKKEKKKKKGQFGKMKKQAHHRKYTAQ